MKDIIIDENILNFDILPFPLVEVTGKNVVKVIHYQIDGTRGYVYTELVENEKNMWFLLKDLLVPKYLKEVERGDLITKNYLFVLLDRYERAIAKVVHFRELVKDVISDAKYKG